MSGQILTRALSLWGKVQNYVTAGLAAAVVVTSVGWYITDLKLDSERSGRKADRAAYVTAQKDYEAKALQNKINVENKNNEERKKQDIAYDGLLAKYRSNLRVYASSQGAVSRNYLPDYAGSAPSSDGPSPSTELPAGPNSSPSRESDYLLISFGDADICAENTVRVIIAQDWYNKVKGNTDGR